MIDEPVRLRLTGVTPGRRVRLVATCADGRGMLYGSWADYEAGPGAAVAPARQKPGGGSYVGADPFGLWWSMAASPECAFARGLEPVATAVRAEIEGEEVARLELRRLRLGLGVTAAPVRHGGLVATLLLPASPPAAGVIVLGGSEGGLGQAEELAALLAARGFSALALAYFGMEGLPRDLVRVPVEYLEAAAEWLLARPEVGGGALGVVGISRGGELGLLFAAECARVRAVVGFAASSVRWPGYAPGQPLPGPAWTRRGTGLPFAIPYRDETTARPARPTARDSFCHALRDQAQLARAAIPVENIAGPVLLVSGGDDELWPSRLLAELAMRRLSRRAAAPRPLHLTYPRAGHGIGRPPGLPAAPVVAVDPRTGLAHHLGGSRAANARAARLAWPRVLSFLETALREPAGGGPPRMVPGPAGRAAARGRGTEGAPSAAPRRPRR